MNHVLELPNFNARNIKWCTEALTVDLLQVELDRLQTKLQFSEEEKRELGNRCRDLEGQIRGASPSKVYSVKSYPFD